MQNCKILLIDCLNDIDNWLAEIFTMLKENWPVVVTNSLSDAELNVINKPFDVIIFNADVSNSTLAIDLEQIDKLSPNSIKVLLLPQEKAELQIEVVNRVHRSYLKPIKTELFYSDITSLVELCSKISHSKYSQDLLSVKSLPSPPQIFTELLSELSSAEPSVSNITSIIKNDVGLTAKLLQLINSAYYGLKTSVQNPATAIKLLGMDTIKNLALTLSTFNKFNKSKFEDYSIESILNYSLEIGKASKTYATVLGLNNTMIENASLAGMLHDIGKLVMINMLPGEFEKSINLSKRDMISLYQAQKEILGLTDAEIGGYLLFLWGLPECIVNAVTYHYMPSEKKQASIDIVTAVHLAYAIDSDTKHIQKENNALDMSYISTLKLENKISNLRSFAVACQV